jgi:hypothetical protein
MPVRSPYPDVEIPAVSLGEFLFGGGVGEHAQTAAFVDGTTGMSGPPGAEEGALSAGWGRGRGRPAAGGVRGPPSA